MTGIETERMLRTETRARKATQVVGNRPAEAVRGFLEGILFEPKADFRVLLIEDRVADAEKIRDWLLESRDPSFTLELATALPVGLRRLERGDFDLVLVGLHLEGAPGLLSLRAARAAAPGIPTVAISGTSGVAREAMHLGASDLLIRGEFTGRMLIRCIEDSRARACR